MHSELQKYSPFREPRWRLDRVLALADHQPSPLRPSRKRDDKYVGEYLRFLLKWRSRASDEERTDLFPEHPALFYAHLLFYHPDREWRWITEACLLSGMTNEEIADEIGTLPSTIEYFEAVFFNVRDRLDKELWVVKHSIGQLSDRHGGRDGQMTDQQWAMLMKLFAYYGGPITLKVLLSGFRRDGTRPQRAEEILSWFDESASLNIRRHAAMAAHRLEVNRYNIIALLDLHVRLVEISKAANDGRSRAAADYEQLIENVLEETHLRVGREGFRNLQRETLKTFGNTHAELRADEMLYADVEKRPLIGGETPESLEKLCITVSSEPAETVKTE